MSANHDIARRPHGQPTGGQFAETHKPTSGLSLAPLPSSMIGGDYEVDESWPQPQANDLEKVSAAVDAINNGANTNAAVAHALDLSEREGAYYSAAAGYLGLVEKDNSQDITVMVPTSLGQRMVAADDSDRAQMLSEMVAHVPAVQSIMDGEEPDEVSQMMVRDELSPITAQRRTDSARSWATQAADVDGFATRVQGARGAVNERAGEAAAIAADEVARARRARAERPAVVCPECFMQIPATGACDCGYEVAAA